MDIKQGISQTWSLPHVAHSLVGNTDKKKAIESSVVLSFRVHVGCYGSTKEKHSTQGRNESGSCIRKTAQLSDTKTWT